MRMGNKTLAVLAALLLPAAIYAGGAKEAAPATTEKTVNAGFVYVGPIGDLGFTNAHDVARVALEKKYSWLKTKYIESVPEGKASPVIAQFIQDEKMDVVFTCSFGYMDETIEAGKKFPDKLFLHCSGYKQSENVGTYFADLYQMYYLNGLMAGSLTKTGKVGYVGAFPIPEVVRHINAWALGVRDANPKAVVDVRWIFSWYDPAKAREAAQALISSGCDALAFTEDSASVVEVGEESTKAGKPVYTFGHYSPMAAMGPESLVSGQLVNWVPLYEKILLGIKDGSWKTGDLLYLTAEGGAELGGKFGEPISPKYVDVLKSTKIKTADLGELSTYDLVMKRLEQMKKGRDVFEPFTGPIKDNTGKERYGAGAKASIPELMSINYYVENVLGKLPEAN
ncbi:MAG: BMP family ABC transporter substrate-binding protein [Treponema sp. GWB1_62_6]|nr:MAG: BMP family ABC transporter substrate-binding protein [Treponema sp. GWB1_62_6]OHE64613.1 MAG: BMP family ABC transporter substrate-binding protein [Treponema sp. GWA1_62_8]OHE69744.1 MAG: BMP family ABC transporter substrate-binding protein [Treponema sp. GWC1_61_84]HCM26754.1 BMP family ABC transporter substrate-binding protein [Treponema sp.]